MTNKNTNVLGSANKGSANKGSANKVNANKVHRGAAFGLALGLAALVALPGLAAADATQSYQLSYNANELKSIDSAKTLHRRIRRVALAHCPDYAITKDLRDRAACIEEVEADLVSKVNHPLLTQIHTGNSVINVASNDR